MGLLHRFLNYHKKVHKYLLIGKNGGTVFFACEYCYDVFFTGNQDNVPFGYGLKYPNEQCNRAKIVTQRKE